MRKISLAWSNYTEPLERFNFWTYLKNSLIVTFIATAITLIINSMAAFALSKYRFKGRDAIFVLIISTLMIPISVVLVPVFLVITRIGWNNSLWGVIIPGAATPPASFCCANTCSPFPTSCWTRRASTAPPNGASTGRSSCRSPAPALAVLAIFSVMWRWNDFLWPLIVLSRTEMFTLQVGLNAFQGELNIQWHYVLAMTVLTLLPITIVFAICNASSRPVSPHRAQSRRKHCHHKRHYA